MTPLRWERMMWSKKLQIDRRCLQNSANILLARGLDLVFMWKKKKKKIFMHKTVIQHREHMNQCHGSSGSLSYDNNYKLLRWRCHVLLDCIPVDKCSFPTPPPHPTTTPFFLKNISKLARHKQPCERSQLSGKNIQTPSLITDCHLGQSGDVTDI